ncbi:mitoregulin isoform X1 [Cebus imitator]|uniref:mitoregulin isoform X1 n=1 Tax=Cebus imitator TaxID=2715852 RepID=UPI0018979342|nr:mitoregulin isoform X1 [Cebus imitator]
MPVPVLGTWDSPVYNGDKNRCPGAAYILARETGYKQSGCCVEKRTWWTYIETWKPDRANAITQRRGDGSLDLLVAIESLPENLKLHKWLAFYCRKKIAVKSLELG